MAQPGGSLMGRAPGPSAAGRLARRWLARAGLGWHWKVSLCALVLIGFSWLAVGVILREKRQDALDAETRQDANLAGVLAEQTLRVVATVDQATLRARDAVVGAPDMPDLVRFANETGLVPEILTQLSFIDATGHFVTSNLDPSGQRSGPLDLSAREHVRVHLAPATSAGEAARLGPDGLFIGKPVLGKVSKKWTIQMSRRVADAQGRTRGVIVASLDPTYFEAVYGKVALGEGGGVSLVGADRTIRARLVDGVAVGVGSELPASSAFAQHLGSDSATYIADSSIDGRRRIYAIRRISSYPLFIAVNTSVDTALAGWRATRDTMVVLSAILDLAVLAAALGFAAGLRRLERTNEALRRSEAQATAANDAKSAFLAAMSHELRTPLTSIRGFAELMEHRLEQPRFREQAGLIRKAAEYLNQLLTEILDITKVDAGEMQLLLESHDIREIVTGAADFYALNAVEKGLTLEAAIDADVPRSLRCDALRLKQVINNLLSNAVKFTASGGVRIDVEAVGDQLLFHVRDTGPGIDSAQQELIFQKFRQGDARVSYEHGGTGLGLALSRSLATLMGGTLAVASAPGQGACFTLCLPTHAATSAGATGG
jgi:signal transduction histidine kinase